MTTVNRREALTLAAAAGAAALVPVGPVSAQEQDRWTVERDRVRACGMTEDEAECWVLTAKTAGQFFALPELHEADQQEVAQAIHVIQHKLLGRPTYRKYLELAKSKAE